VVGLRLCWAAHRNRPDDLFITRELHTRKALRWPASAASTKAIQLGQPGGIEVMYAQNTPTPKAPSSTQQMRFKGGLPGCPHLLVLAGLGFRPQPRRVNR
jgi:hypothetical protein